MKARIYRPARSAMQSGYAKTKYWLLEFEPEKGRRFIEPLMGWTASNDMKQELFLRFETKEEAIEYATKNDIDYELFEPNKRKVKPKSYADNFKFNKPAA